MLNVYSVIVCNPAKNTRGNFNASMTFERYLLSTDGQNLFGNFGVQGKTVFSLWIPTLTAGTDTTTIQWVETYAYIQGSECPTQYRLNAADLYK
jgi:hypothetical protein